MLGRTTELQQALRARQIVRVARGVYRNAAAMTGDPERRADDEFVARVRAAQVREPEPLVFAGMAAAALWELPIVGRWPERVTVATAPDTGGRSNSHLARTYAGHPAPTVELNGLRVTSLARTVVDVARGETMERAVAMMDAALHGQTAGFGRSARSAVARAEVEHELEVLGPIAGSAKARGILSFSDARSGSTGESCSRVGIWRLGLPRPVLQQAFYDDRGKIGVVDFWWPDFGLIGEFDGRGKYLKEEYTHGRTAAEVVFEEKAREDRLRALGPTMVRWDWPVALNLRALEAKLRGAGLR